MCIVYSINYKTTNKLYLFVYVAGAMNTETKSENYVTTKLQMFVISGEG